MKRKFLITGVASLLILLTAVSGLYLSRNKQNKSQKEEFNLQYFQTPNYTFYYPDNYESISSNINHYSGKMIVESYLFGEKIKDPMGNEASDYSISFSFKKEKYGMDSFDSCKKIAEYEVFQGYKVDDSLTDINFKNEKNIRTCSFKTKQRPSFGDVLTERKIVSDDSSYFDAQILYKVDGDSAKIRRLQEAFSVTRLN
jgi:hypothetical protein